MRWKTEGIRYNVEGIRYKVEGIRWKTEDQRQNKAKQATLNLELKKCTDILKSGSDFLSGS